MRTVRQNASVKLAAMAITRRQLLIGGGALAVAAAAGGTLVVLTEPETPGSVDMSWVADAVTAEELSAAARVKVFFGHQSVGMNLIGGVPGVFAGKGVPAPRIVEVGEQTGLPAEGGFLAHAYVGENGDPVGKLRDFDAKLRSGLAEQVEVALVKFCYVDITSDTDVDALFREYQTTLAALERDFPAVTFLHATHALTTEETAGRKAALMRMLGRTDTSRADNATRHRLNELVRQAYGPDRLFDLAAAEATTPDGGTVAGTVDGKEYQALYTGYAADSGHLNEAGSQLVAARLLGVIARTAAARS